MMIKQIRSLAVAMLWLIGSVAQANLVTHTFTNAGASGRFGPSQSQVNSAYGPTNSLNGEVSVIGQGVQRWTAPQTGTYTIEAFGASGGNSASTNTGPGLGAQMRGEFFLPQGFTLSIIVGQQGGSGGNTNGGAGGGGGGSFVTSGNSPLTVAAGGNGENWFRWFTDGPDGRTNNNGTSGGSGARGAGGGGFFGSGQTVSGASGGLSFVNGGVGGFASNSWGEDGGFGGGGASIHEGGGGGGYSGGRVVPVNQYGASFPTYGAGSINTGSNQLNLSGVNSGHGRVTISFIAVPEASQILAWSLLSSILLTIRNRKSRQPS